LSIYSCNWTSSHRVKLGLFTDENSFTVSVLTTYKMMLYIGACGNQKVWYLC